MANTHIHTHAYRGTLAVNIINDAFIICCKLLRTIMMMSGHVPAGQRTHAHTHTHRLIGILHTHTLTHMCRCHTNTCLSVLSCLSWHLALIAA